MAAAQFKCILMDYISSIQGATNSQDKLVHQVPLEVREPHIKTGYRPVDSGFKKTLQSLWRSHNETLNIWTHVCGLFYFLYFFCDKDFWKQIGHIPSSQSLPMYVYFFGVCFLFLASSGAHLFNSISITWRNICFMIDYSAISVYGSFTAVVYYYYNWSYRLPKIVMDAEYYFIPIVLFTSIFATWISCKTRLYHNNLCHVIRTTSFALPFVIGSIPPMVRVCNHLYSYVIPSVIMSTNHSQISENISAEIQHSHHINKTIIGLTETEYCYYYGRHLFHLTAAAVVNMIKVPECIYPGNFDIVGHSHQVFHILIFMGVKEQFWLLINDISQFGRSYTWSTYPDGVMKEPISMSYLAVLYALLICSLGSILVWYGYSIHLLQKKQSTKKD